MTCPNCSKQDLEDNDLFCPNCGTDLQSYAKVQKYSSSKIDLVSQLQSSKASTLVLTKETISDYQKLSHEMHDLQDIPQKLSLSNQQLQFMTSKLTQDSNLLTNLKNQLDEENHDIEKLKKVSVTSVIAKVKGDKEQRLKKEEQEAVVLLNKIQGLETQVASQKNDVNSLTQHVEDLKNLNIRLGQNKEALVKLIYQSTQGVPDPVEEKVEKELQSLLKSYNPIQAEIQNKQKVVYYLQSAYNDLNNAYESLNSASNYNNWDMFFGGGMITDSIKHSRMSNARDAVGRANNSIDLARNLDPNLPGINAFVQDFSLFFNIMFDNIFEDWNIQNKISNSLDSVQQSLYELQNTISKVQTDINTITNRLASLESKIGEVRDHLLLERTRMIEEAIKKHQ